MRALACPASLKGVLTAPEAAAALAEGLRAGGAEATELPVADGGEGTAEALWLALGGEWREADVHAPLPAAGLVLLLMNVATIFPLWPGNIGLLQAAVALPLVQYGVAYSNGFAYGLVLQVLEMAVGVGVGLLFLAREGLSFANLRNMPDATDVADEPDAETHPPERRRARTRVPG